MRILTMRILALRTHRQVLTLALLLACALPAQVKFLTGQEKIDVSIDGSPFTAFYYGAASPKPYLHPIRAANGTIVTRGYPMADVEGERRDHPHHRGLWFTHGEVNGIDFWANEPSQEVPNKGVITVEEIRASGDTIEARFAWKTPDGKPVLSEDRIMKFYAGAGVGDGNRVIDFDFTLTAGPKPVHFGDTKEGTFAIRLATQLEEPHTRGTGIERTGIITSASGKTGEEDTWGKRSPWLDYSGRIGGKKLGVTIMDHPGNPKHPTYWHVRSYGLFAANVFGEHHFYRDDKRDGSITLEPGQSLRFRYRVVVHAGDVEEAGVARLYDDYKNGKALGATQ